jgi:glycolate oxidase
MMRMPEPEQRILDSRLDLARELARLVGEGNVIVSAEELRAYECDALTAYRQPPLLVVLPDSAEQAAAALSLCSRRGVKVVPRGAGTSLSGGALPLADGIVLGLAKLNRIKEIDYVNRCVVAEPGVTNLAITHAVAHRGFYYAPDPSSQVACTIGGNVAENSGGVHCLKYGLTTNNLLGVRLLLMTGETLEIGGKHQDRDGYDLLGLVTGSEGLLGVVAEVTVRILRKPASARVLVLGFPSPAAAGACVGRILAAGIVPAAMEMMDRLALEAVEAFCHPGYPREAAAVLLVELDGVSSEVDHFVGAVTAIANASGASSVRASRSAAERDRLWAGRKAAFPAVGRLAPDYYCMDGTIPRHRLPEVLDSIAELSQRFGLRVANVFHAGDGNLHPLILYDANRAGELETAEKLGAEILRLCVRVGGVLTGEHGVGVEKRDLMPEMFDETDLAQQERIKCAFDPDGRLNPGKMFPTLHRCVELGRTHVHGAAPRFADLPRL